MPRKLEKIFNNVKEVSQLLRKVPNFDGQKFWQPIKKELNEHDITFNKWKELSEFHKNLINIEEYDKYNKMIEIKHFIRQHANIPINDRPNLTKIIQIALNSGQFLGSATEHDINKYNKNKLGKITTYMHKKDIKKVSEEIPDQVIVNIKKYLDEQLKQLN
jgi:cell fate (sporulation/competence/biofilm development) regulator YmcA (YheA/YmcA/DUF963 family)